MTGITPEAAANVVLDIYSRSFEWGISDCCTAPCDAFFRLHGIDPLAPVRGRYSSAQSAARLMLIAGGAASMARDLARLAGLVPSTGGPGDIGIVGGARQAIGALCVAPGQWAVKGPAGMVIAFQAMEAWTCPPQ